MKNSLKVFIILSLIKELLSVGGNRICSWKWYFHTYVNSVMYEEFNGFETEYFNSLSNSESSITKTKTEVKVYRDNNSFLFCLCVLIT